MKPISIAQDIVPLGEFKAKASRLLDEVEAGRQAVVITRNGRPVGVVISPDDYDRLVERQSYLQDIAEGLADAEAGRLISTDQLLEDLGLADEEGDEEVREAG